MSGRIETFLMPLSPPFSPISQTIGASVEMSTMDAAQPTICSSQHPPIQVGQKTARIPSPALSTKRTH